MSKARLVITGAAGLAAAVSLAAPTVMRWEGLALDPYVDLAGVKTVCWGETANIQDRRHTRAECDAKLNRSLTKHARPILACLPETAPLGVKAAFSSFGYNVGVTAACNSTAAKKARAGDYRGACDGLLAWNKARVNGVLKPIKGLTKRRQDERALCLSGLA
jgi:lysozyme